MDFVSYNIPILQKVFKCLNNLRKFIDILFLSEHEKIIILHEKIKVVMCLEATVDATVNFKICVINRDYLN